MFGNKAQIQYEKQQMMRNITEQAKQEIEEKRQEFRLEKIWEEILDTIDEIFERVDASQNNKYPLTIDDVLDVLSEVLVKYNT